MKFFARTAFLLSLLPMLVRAQEPHPDTATLSVDVRVVAFDAVVRNRSSELVHGLTRDDFTLTEDGKPQPLRYFNEDSDLPLTIGLMVDTSGSQRQYFAEQQIASQTFLTNMLTRPKDTAFLVRFDSSALMLQKMTPNLGLLTRALGFLTMKFPPPADPHAGTLLFDAICGVAANAFLEPGGRRAVVILTDGEDNGSTRNRDQATQCAQFANIAVYTALYTSRDPGSMEQDDPRVPVYVRSHLMGRTTMERISRATGGRLFVVTPKLPIERIYELIQQDLRNQYRIGYTPSPSPPRSYHVLELKPRDRRYKIQSRMGYFTPAGPEPKAP